MEIALIIGTTDAYRAYKTTRSTENRYFIHDASGVIHAGFCRSCAGSINREYNDIIHARIDLRDIIESGGSSRSTATEPRANDRRARVCVARYSRVMDDSQNLNQNVKIDFQKT